MVTISKEKLSAVMMDLFKDEVPKNGFQEIIRLENMLKEKNIPYIIRPEFGGYHIIYNGHSKNKGSFVCSIIEHCGSYGREEDKLEIMGLLTEEEKQHDSVKGYLTAEEVFDRILRDWEK